MGVPQTRSGRARHLHSDAVRARLRAYEALVRGNQPDPVPRSPRTGGVLAWVPDPDAPRGDDRVPVDLPEGVLDAERAVRALGQELLTDRQPVRRRWLDGADVRAASSGAIDRPDLDPLASTQPAVGGLFCSRTFGPRRDYACECPTPAPRKHRGIRCPTCGVVSVRPSEGQRLARHREPTQPAAARCGPPDPPGGSRGRRLGRPPRARSCRPSRSPVGRRTARGRVAAHSQV